MDNTDSQPKLTNCTFIANSVELKYGGGMRNYNSTPILINCVFVGNSGASQGGGMYNHRHSKPSLTNCMFSANTAAKGGGIRNVLESNPTLINCTFSSNQADAGWGGGIDNIYNSRPKLTNCILWGDGNEISNSDISTTTVSYSDVQGGWPGIGNIDADPLFADADLRLSAGSPCIDAGVNSAVLVATDLDGNPRIVNGIVDMGAYEAPD
jgi:hypothetical protein